jgi:hypothetical protein
VLKARITDLWDPLWAKTWWLFPLHDQPARGNVGVGRGYSVKRMQRNHGWKPVFQH